MPRLRTAGFAVPLTYRHPSASWCDGPHCTRCPSSVSREVQPEALAGPTAGVHVRRSLARSFLDRGCTASCRRWNVSATSSAPLTVPSTRSGPGVLKSGPNEHMRLVAANRGLLTGLASEVKGHVGPAVFSGREVVMIDEVAPAAGVAEVSMQLGRTTELPLDGERSSGLRSAGGIGCAMAAAAKAQALQRQDRRRSRRVARTTGGCASLAYRHQPGGTSCGHLRHRNRHHRAGRGAAVSRRGRSRATAAHQGRIRHRRAPKAADRTARQPLRAVRGVLGSHMLVSAR